MSTRGPKAAIVIPTLNAGPVLSRVLDGVGRQQTPWDYELIVVDSGSTDGTIEAVESFARAGRAPTRLHRIARSEFGHGRTRNLGASLSRSDVIVLLTHDATPAEPHWLARLVGAVEQAPDIAGAFGRHLPYEDADPLTRRDLTAFFDSMAGQPVVGIDDRVRYRSDLRYRQRLHYYSDNNSAMRRSVWRQIPYPDVRWGEDQLWARRVLEHGYRIAYASDAPVYHSHDYPPRQAVRRASEEHAFWQEYFNYDGVSDLLTVLRFTRSFARHDVDWLAGQSCGLTLRRRMGVYARTFARFWGEYRGRRSVLRARRAALAAGQTGRKAKSQ